MSYPQDSPGGAARGVIQIGVRCAKCNDSVYSNSRHDLVTCKCGAVFIDGGFDYRRLGGNREDFVGISREIDRGTLPLYFRRAARR